MGKAKYERRNRYVSVSAATGDRVDNWCKLTGDTQGELVDRAVLPWLDTVAPVPESDRPKPPTLRELKRHREAAQDDPGDRLHPEGTICASCTRDVGGQPYRDMEHNGAMVALCVKCSDEPVRERSYLFGGHGGGIGEGNRRAGPQRSR